MKGGKVNWPFVAIAAAVVGLALGTYIGTAAPPLRNVSTYMVFGSAPTPNGITAVSVQCNPGDSVMSVGYRTTYKGEVFFYGNPEFGVYGVIASEPYTSENGDQGWRVTLADGFPHQDLPDPSVNPVLEVTAICLHRA